MDKVKQPRNEGIPENAHRVQMPKTVVKAMSRKTLANQLASTLAYDVDFMRLCMALRIKPKAVDSLKMSLVNFYIDYHRPLEYSCDNSLGMMPREIPDKFIPPVEISETGFATETDLFYPRSTTDDIICKEYAKEKLFDIVGYEESAKDDEEEN